jgi:hypothetical protein
VTADEVHDDVRIRASTGGGEDGISREFEAATQGQLFGRLEM